MKNKIRQSFIKYEGGLFNNVDKADVGDAYDKLRADGVDMMAWADPFSPDFSLPPHVMEATIDAVESPVSAHYTAPVGDLSLKKIIAKKLRDKNNLKVDPNRNILITPGSDSGLFYSMLSVLDNGDEVLVPTPSYPNNIQNCELIGATAIPIELKKENGFQFNIKDFERALTNKTKAVLITHPNNPTTTVFNENSINELSKFIIANDLILICDQAFEDFTFDNKFVTPASVDGMWERTVTIFSVSKGMGFSGYRVGYVVASDVFIDYLYGSAVSVIGATNTVSQKAVIKAFENSEFMEEFEVAFDYRRKKAYEIINDIPNVSMLLPESGFLCWIDVSKIGTSSEVVSYLIKEAKVYVNDGINYGIGGSGHIRIVLGVYRDSDKVIDALKRIRTALIKFQGVDII